jgi:type IV/VI secretion system ImpK/VasF family protein
MNPSLLRSFRPLFETLSALAAGTQAAHAAELRPLRADLRQRLLALKQELAPRVGERECYLMLFALVVHFDEVVRTSFPEADHATWPLLQKELFDTDRGGDLFYQSLAELLETQKGAGPVHEVYFFCLTLGFRGKYAQDPEPRTQLMNKLRALLAAAVPVPREIDLAGERPAQARVPRLRSRAWPYAAAAALVLGVYASLATLAATATAQWREADAGLSVPASAGQQAAVPAGRVRTVEDCSGGRPCRSS